MIRLLGLAVAGLFFVTPAYADFTAKDASAATITFKNAATCTASVCIPQTAITDSTGTSFVVVTTAGADAQSNTANGLLNYARNLVFNGTTWDRWTGAVTVSSGTVTANIGTIAGIATAANQPTAAAQASTTSGQTGTLVQCAVTTTAPTYTTAQTDPLSCDTAGNVRVNVTNANVNGPAAAVNSGPVTLPVLNHSSVTALGNSLVVKASAGNLNGFNCTAITGAAAGFCIAYNATTAPATGALTGSLVLDSCFFDTTSRGCSLAHANGAINFSAGIVILVTSAATPFTYTTGTDTAYIEADYD